MIEVDGQSRTVGLALSGGGFRASIFHLGVVKRLHELDILKDIDVISTVSGGSILGAFIVANWDRLGDMDSLETEFRAGLQANIRLRALTGSLVFHPIDALRAILPDYTRSHIVAKEFDEHFFHRAPLSSLPETPRLVINATSLTTGQIWKFTKDEMGDYRYGFSPAADYPLANAVAASAAVPGLFAPVVLDDVAGKVPAERICLADGGVRDNQGLTTLFSEEPDYIISSDASGLINIDSNPSKLATKVLLRSNSITMDAGRDLLVQKLFSLKESGHIQQMVFFDMEDDVPAGTPGLPNGLIPLAANVRTDLDYFSDAEIETLQYHGYTLVDYLLHKYGSDMLGTEAKPLSTLKYTQAKIEQIKKEMEKSHKIRFRPHKF